jgi:hypothetical protein
LRAKLWTLWPKKRKVALEKEKMKGKLKHTLSICVPLPSPSSKYDDLK